MRWCFLFLIPIWAIAQSNGNVRVSLWKDTTYVTGTYTGSGILMATSSTIPQTLAIGSDFVSSGTLAIAPIVSSTHSWTGSNTFYGGGQPSIDTWNRQLISSSGLIGRVDWGNGVLRDGLNFDVVDWEDKKLSDGVGQEALNWNSRVLLDSTGMTSIDWETRSLSDVLGVGSVVYSERTLRDSNYTISVDWQNRNLIDNNGVTLVDWYDTTFIVNNTLQAGRLSLQANTLSNSQNITNTSNVSYTGTGGHTFTVGGPNSAVGRIIFVKNRGSGSVTIQGNTNQLYDTSPTTTISIPPGSAMTLVSDGSYWNIQ